MNYLQNLIALRDVVASQPSEMLNLDRWAAPHSCGTIHCIGGWAAVHPYFQALGMRPDPIDGSPTMLAAEEGEYDIGTFTTLDHFFGEYELEDVAVDAYDIIFAAFGDGDIDELLSDENDGRFETHKDLALARLDWAINYWENRQ